MGITRDILDDRRIALLIIVVLGLGMVALAPGLAGASEETPNVSVYVADETIETGTEHPLELQVLNDGSGIDGDGSITNVTVSVDDAPFDVNPEVTPVGAIPDGQIGSVAPVLTIPDGVEPGTYTVAGTVNYTYFDANERFRNGTTFSVDVTVRDEARFELRTIENELTGGETGEISFEIENVGTAPASDITTTMTGTSGVILGDGSAAISIAELAPNESVAFTIDATVPDQQSLDDRPVTATIEYVDDRGFDRLDESVQAAITPNPSPSVVLVDVSATVAVGQEGELTGEIRNDGPRDLERAVVRIEPGSESLVPAETRIPIGSFLVNETATFQTSVQVPPGADDGSRDVDVVVEYRGADGSTLATDRMSAMVDIDPEQTFAIDTVEDTLAVGYDGEITGEITNLGPETIDDAVIVIEPRSDSLFVSDTRYALPSLEPGESVSFRYPTDVSGDADAGPRQVAFTVEYGGADGQTLQTDPMTDRVTVDPRTDEFDLAGIETELRAGATDELVIEITNQLPEPVTDIDAKLFADSPLSVTADSAFVPALAPNESVEISFELQTAGDARLNTYPVELDFEYTTERGETTLSDVYQFPVDVIEDDTADDEDSFLSNPFLLGGALLVIVAVLSLLWWNRR